MKVSGRFGGTYQLYLQGLRRSQATNQHEAACFMFSGASVAFQRTARRHILEDGPVRNNRWEYPKYYDPK
jgi:hypothetical protein